VSKAPDLILIGDTEHAEPIEPLAPGQIKKIREDSRVSQAVFAAVLNTSLSTVQKWEIGQKRPTGTALKLLHLVQKRGLESVV
jgi:putative transcriptional regulator